MARRGTNHSFNKRQKELKRKEKAQRKLERRNAKKQDAVADVAPPTGEESFESVADSTSSPVEQPDTEGKEASKDPIGPAPQND